MKGGQSFFQSRLLSTVPEDASGCHDNGARTWYLRHGRTVGDRGSGAGTGAGRLRHLANTDEDHEIIFVANMNNESSCSPLLDQRSHSMTHFINADEGFKQQTTTAFVRWQHPRSLLHKTESMELAPPTECLDKQTQLLLLQSGRSSMV